MRAVVIHKHGGPEVLTLESHWPTPTAGPGEIVVRVKACALNFLDIFTREGMPGEPTPLPHITGGDVAGVVAQVGPGVTRPAVGTRVVLNPNWGCGVCEYCREGQTPRCLHGHMLGELDPGGLAEYVKCPAAQAITIPDFYPFENAACLPVAFGTAWRMVVTHSRIRPNDTVLVLGAGGGVAIAAIQIAKLQGARVIATASTDEKLERAKRFGADKLINYARDTDWDVTTRKLTGKRGVDVVIETVGETTWERSIRALGKGGRLVTCGATSGPIGETDIRVVFWKQISIIGSTMSSNAEFHDVMRELFRGRLRAIVDTVMPLKDGVEAQRRLAEGKQFGKIVLTP